MDIKRCDGCNQDSPDKRGWFVANNWYKLEVKHRQCLSKKYDLCERCWERLLNVIKSRDVQESR